MSSFTEGTGYVAFVASLNEFCELPRAPFETTDLAVGAPNAIDLGRIMCSDAPSAENVAIIAPSSTRPESDLLISLVLSDHYRNSVDEEVRIALDSLAVHACVEAWLYEDGVPPRALVVGSYDVDESERRVRVTIPLPTVNDVAAAIVITSVRVAGKCVHVSDTPILVRAGGSVPPMLIPECGGPYGTVAVSSRGRIYASKHDKDLVRVFDITGANLPSEAVRIADYGLSDDVRAVAVYETNQWLVMGDFKSGRLAAIDLSTRAPIWTTPGSVGGSILGLAVIEKAGIVVVAACSANSVFAFRIADGTLASTLTLAYPIHVATDPLTDEIIVSGPKNVTSIVWTGTALESRGVVGGLSTMTNHVLLTIIPPAPGSGRKHSHLVVAPFGADFVDVVSLPDHTVVMKQKRIKGASISGFMTDHWGSSLGLVSGGSTRVLEWPLEGLPELK
jgi:hypothetical protein